jgi:hypothetical protein
MAVEGAAVNWGATLMYNAMLGSAYVGAYSAYNQGQHQKQLVKTQAQQEKVKAKDQEIERKRRLVSILATRNAMTGATGMAPTGSFANLQRRDMRLASLDDAAATANLKSNLSMLRARGQNAYQTGLLQAGGSLLGAGYNASRIG